MLAESYAGDAGIKPGVAPDFLQAPGYRGSQLTSSRSAESGDTAVQDVISQLGLTTLGDARHPTLGTYKEVPTSLETLVSTLSAGGARSNVLATVVLDEVTEQLATIVGPKGLFPFRALDPKESPELILEKLIFDSEVAKQLPETAVPFVPSHHRSSEQVTLNRVGMGLEILTTVLQTKQGLAMWGMQLKQLSAAVERYVYLSVFAAIEQEAASPETADEQMQTMALYRTAPWASLNWRERMKKEIGRFNVLLDSDGGGAIKLQQQSVEVYRNRAVPHDTIVLLVPSGTTMAFQRLAAAKFSYSEAGPLGPKVRYGGKDAIGVGVREIDIRESRVIKVAKDRAIDPLESESSVGEVFPMETCHVSSKHLESKVTLINRHAATIAPAFADAGSDTIRAVGEELMTLEATTERHERSIEIMDYERDAPTVISLADAIRYAGFDTVLDDREGRVAAQLYRDFVSGGYTDDAIYMLFAFAIGEQSSFANNSQSHDFVTRNGVDFLQLHGFEAANLAARAIFACSVNNMLTQVLIRLCNSGIPLPLNFIIYRPHMRLGVGSAFAVVPGSQTAEVVWSRPNFIVGADAYSTKVFGNFSVFTRCVVKDRDQLIVYSNARLIRFLEGCGCSFWDPSSPQDVANYAEYGSGTRPSKSMFSMYTAFKSWSGCIDSLNPSDLSGRLDDRFMGHRGGCSNFAEWYAGYWSFPSTQAVHVGGQLAHCPAPHNTVCLLGPYVVHDEKGRNLFVNGEGHFGAHIPARGVTKLLTGNTSKDLVRFPDCAVYTRPDILQGV